MDFGPHRFLYNRSPFPQQVSDSSLCEIDEQCAYRARFPYSSLSATPPPAESALPYSAMNSNMFLPHSGAGEEAMKEEGLSHAASFYATMEHLPNGFGLDMSMASLRDRAIEPLLDGTTELMTVLPSKASQAKQGLLRQDLSPGHHNQTTSPDRNKREREMPSPLQLVMPTFCSFDEIALEDEQLCSAAKRVVRARGTRASQVKSNLRGVVAETREQEGDRDLQGGRVETDIPLQSPECSAATDAVGLAQGLVESPRTKQQRDQDDLERILRSDQDLAQQLSGAEPWQGDWSIAAAAAQGPAAVHAQHNPIVQSEQYPFDDTHHEIPIPSFLTAEERRKLETSSGQLFTVAVDPRASLSATVSKTLEENTELTCGSFLPGEIVQMEKETHASYHIPHSAPPMAHSYSSGPMKLEPARNSIYHFTPDHETGELGWAVEEQSSRFQTSPLLNSKVHFPTRPLNPGVLARIHNDWLEEYPMPVAEGSLEAKDRRGIKQFPTPQMNFESQHIRTLWQELERRRILEMTDGNLFNRLRQEATVLLKSEAMAGMALAGIDAISQERYLSKHLEPTEEQIKKKAQALWEQTRKSAVYAVGLLRQAEYCIAHGHLGFMPLNHIRSRPTPLTSGHVSATTGPTIQPPLAAPQGESARVSRARARAKHRSDEDGVH